MGIKFEEAFLKALKKNTLINKAVKKKADSGWGTLKRQLARVLFIIG